MPTVNERSGSRGRCAVGRALNEPAGMGVVAVGLEAARETGKRTREVRESTGRAVQRNGETNVGEVNGSRARGRTRRESGARDHRAPCSTRCRPWRRWRRAGCRHRRRESGRGRARRRPRAQHRRESGHDRARRHRRSVRRNSSSSARVVVRRRTMCSARDRGFEARVPKKRRYLTLIQVPSAQISISGRALVNLDY